MITIKRDKIPGIYHLRGKHTAIEYCHRTGRMLAWILAEGNNHLGAIACRHVVNLWLASQPKPVELIDAVNIARALEADGTDIDPQSIPVEDAR